MKTGRPANPVPSTSVIPQNNTTTTTTNNSTSASALLQPKSSSPISLPASSPNTPAEVRTGITHPASALGIQHQSSATKNPNPVVTLKFRREMTQPIISRAELVSTMDYPLEKLVMNDNFPVQYRSNITSTKLNQNHQSDLRCKQLKINPGRFCSDYYPARHLSRSRINDRLPSPKGKRFVFLFIFFFYDKKNIFCYLIRLS